MTKRRITGWRAWLWMLPALLLLAIRWIILGDVRWSLYKWGFQGEVIE